MKKTTLHYVTHSTLLKICSEKKERQSSAVGRYLVLYVILDCQPFFLERSCNGDYPQSRDDEVFTVSDTAVIIMVMMANTQEGFVSVNSCVDQEEHAHTWQYLEAWMFPPTWEVEQLFRVAN